MGACFVLCLLIKDKGLTRPEEKVQQPEASGSETGVGGESDVEMHVQEALRKWSNIEVTTKSLNGKLTSSYEWEAVI